MSDSRLQVDLAEIKFLETHLTHRARICYAMIGAGVICLIAGVVMLIVGLTGEQVIWFDSANIKITAGGFGAVTMVASVAWGFAAYLARPEIRYRGNDRDFQLGPPSRRSRFRR